MQQDRGYSLQDRAEDRIAAAMAEIDEDSAGFQRYLMSRASIHDPRLSTAVFASNSMRRAKHGPAAEAVEHCLSSMASNYAGSRLDPFMHTMGGLRDINGVEPYPGADLVSAAGVSASRPAARSKVDPIPSQQNRRPRRH